MKTTKKCTTLKCFKCTVDMWVTISDQNGDGVYDHLDIWAKYDTPLGGDGIWEKHGDFSFKDENGNGYINTDPSLDPGETDYISVMTFTPAYEYANPDGFRIEFRDITTDEVTGVFASNFQRTYALLYFLQKSSNYHSIIFCILKYGKFYKHLS